MVKCEVSREMRNIPAKSKVFLLEGICCKLLSISANITVTNCPVYAYVHTCLTAPLLPQSYVQLHVLLQRAAVKALSSACFKPDPDGKAKVTADWMKHAADEQVSQQEDA